MICKREDKKYCSKKCYDTIYKFLNKNKIRLQKIKYHKEYNIRPDVTTRNKEYQRTYYLRTYEKKYVYRHLEKNKERKKIVKRIWDKYKLKTDVLFYLRARISVRTNFYFSKIAINKKVSTQELLGCEWKELKKQFETQFTKGMSWKNKGKWHIDHIIPLASAKNETQLIKLCHYTNLQPLWASDNLKKGASVQ